MEVSYCCSMKFVEVDIKHIYVVYENALILTATNIVVNFVGGVVHRHRTLKLVNTNS